MPFEPKPPPNEQRRATLETLAIILLLAVFTAMLIVNVIRGLLGYGWNL